MNALVGQEAKANFARMAVISPARALADISAGDASSMFFMTGSGE
jgi:hypothetical protein